MKRQIYRFDSPYEFMWKLLIVFNFFLNLNTDKKFNLLFLQITKRNILLKISFISNCDYCYVT